MTARKVWLALSVPGILAVPGLLVGCGGGGTVPSTTASSEVGPDGGTVSVTYGPATNASVEVPAGALAEVTTITVSPGSTISYDRYVPVGAPVQFEPFDIVLALDATITVPYTATSILAGKTSSDIVILWRDEATGDVTPLAVSAINEALPTVTALSSSFGTFQAAILDDIPPAVASTDPADGTRAVDRQTTITVTFDEPVNPATVTSASFSLDGGVTGSVTCSGTTATLTPSSPLAASTVYTGTIGAAVEDAVGNPVGADFTWSFETHSFAGGGSVIYVKQGSPGADTGLSWTYAFEHLEDALAVAGSGDEIWVAKGTYLPGTNPSDTFQLVSSVGLFGGFGGYETERSQRNPAAYQTVLSGDVNGDDVGLTNMSDNAYTVVTGAVGVSDVLIDGFTITGGYATTSSPSNGRGAGIFIDTCVNVQIVDCAFDYNYGWQYGGGVSSLNSSLSIIYCTGTGNLSARGAAVCNDGSTADVFACDFSSNEASLGGGAVFNTGGTVTIEGCTFDLNYSPRAGGVYSGPGVVSIIDCTFTSNQGQEGGAVTNYDATVTISGCSFQGNEIVDLGGAFQRGGALLNDGISDLTLSDSSFVGNLATVGTSFGGAIFNEYTASLAMNGCTFAQNADGAVIDVRGTSTTTGCDFTDNADGALRIGLSFGVSGTFAVTDCTFARTVSGDSYGALSIGYGAIGTVSGCTFIDNQAGGDGGAIYVHNTDLDRIGDTDIVDCVFRGNSAVNGGAVACYLQKGFFNGQLVTLRNCALQGNSASTSGGGLHLLSADVTLESCVLAANDATESGGAVYSENYTTVAATNCTIVGNTAGVSAGGFHLGVNTEFALTNTILQGNTAPADPVVSTGSTTVCTVARSRVEGALDGSGCFRIDPLFVDPADPDGADDTFGTPDDGLHLQPGSPCIDMADGDAAPATDICGTARLDDAGMPDAGPGTPAYADIGAYEFQGVTTGSWCDVLDPGTGDLLRVGDPVEIRWHSSGDFAAAKIDISFDGGAVFEEVIAPAAPNVRSYTWTVTDFARGLPLRGCVIRVSDAADDSPAGVSTPFAIYGGALFVDAAAPAGGDGLDWAGALRHPMDAVEAGQAEGHEIWVRAGTYSRRSAGDTVLLTMRNGVNLYGGFAGTESVRGDRDWNANATVLDGEGVCDHVVTGASRARLDGFVVTGGVADGGDEESRGGGVYNGHVEEMVVANCSITGNTAATNGGGLCSYYSDVTVANCTFTGNSANWSGGVSVISWGDFLAVGCVFTGNSAVYSGGGASISSLTTSRFVNCTFYGNAAPKGGGLSTGTEYVVPVYGWLDNCIFWNGTIDGSGLAVSYSCVEGGHAGTGNISVDPLFADTVDPDGPDDVLGTADDGLRLSAGSPCIDAADNSAVAADSADLDGDGDVAEPTPLDSAEQPRFVDDPATTDTGSGSAPVVDVGAYEYQ